MLGNNLNTQPTKTNVPTLDANATTGTHDRTNPVTQPTEGKIAAETIKPQQIHRVKPKTQTKTQKIHELIEAGCHKVTTIAKAADCNHALVSRVLSRYNIEQDQVDGYKRNRADVLAGIQHRLIKSLTEEDIKKAPLGSRVLAAAQLYDKERLERNQSTANIATAHGITPEMQELYDRITKKAKVEGNIIDVKSGGQIEAGNG